MSKGLGILLMITSLACIVSTFIDVVTGKTPLFSPTAIGGYIFHPVTMVAGVALILRSRKAAEKREEE